MVASFIDFKTNPTNDSFDSLLKELFIYKKSLSEHDPSEHDINKPFPPCNKCRDKGLVKGFIHCEDCRKPLDCQKCENYCVYQSMQDELDENYYDPKMSNNTFLVVMDNFENLISEDRFDESMQKISLFYTQLQNFLRESNFNFRMVFVSNKNISLMMPKIELVYPTPEILKEYVAKLINEDFNKPSNRPRYFEVFGLDKGGNQSSERSSQRFNMLQQNLYNLADYIVETVKGQVRDFKVVDIITKKCLEHSLSCNIIENKGSSQGSILSNRCHKLLKLFSVNPKISFRPLNYITKMVEDVLSEDGSLLSDVSTLQARVTHSELKSTEKHCTESFTLPTIPAVLLIAIFIANVLPEKKDSYLLNNASRLKGSRNSKKQNEQKEFGNIKKVPAAKERIEFFAQFLLDIVLRNTPGEEKNRELTLKHQSSIFVTSYQLLEEHKFISRKCTSGIDEFTNIKFEYQCEIAKIQALAKHCDLVLDEFANVN